MTLEARLPALPFLLSAGISVWMALSVFGRQNVKGRAALGVLLLQFSIWAAASAVRVSMAAPARQAAWLRLADAALAFAPLTIFVFVARLTDADHRLTPLNLFLLSVEPFLAVFMIATNDAHGLYYTGFETVPIRGASEVVAGRGPWFWIHQGLSYLFILAAALTLMRLLLRAGPYVRLQLVTVLAGCLLPWGVNLYGLLSPLEGNRLATAPVAVAASGLLFAYALFRQRLLDITPIARSLLFENLSDAVLVLDGSGRLVDLNTAARQMLQLGRESFGRTLAEAMPQWSDLVEELNRFTSESHLEVQSRLDPQRFFDLSLIALVDSRGSHSGYLISVRDISQRKQTEMEVQRMNARLRRQVRKISVLHEELREQAIRDVLTGLFNRRYLDETLQREFSQARRAGYPISVILIDVDQFKRVNDTYGHKAGDRVLRRMGEIIRSHVRAGDIPCRFGGEEFVIVMPNTSLETAYLRAEEIRQRFAATHFFKVQAGVIPTLSVGIALYPTHGRSEEKILHAADQAMYLAKSRGGDQSVRYDSRQKALPVPALKVRR